MKHSSVVGGSTAKRVINCPGSVALCATMPAKPSSRYADEGTLLHDVISTILGSDTLQPTELLGKTYEGIEFTQELLDNKIRPALDLLDQVDPEETMAYEVESAVSFGDYIPGAFGSADLIGRIGTRAVMLDWKFGEGVAVDAAENEQLLFYAAAAMRTTETAWAFKDATEIECVIIQPPTIKRWVTTPARVKQFERTLKSAVKLSQTPDAPLLVGSHCRWCSAKPICPQMTGAVDRALQTKMQGLDAPMISAYLKNAEMLETWISSLRELALQMLESGAKLPDYKLVAKRAIRQWTDEDKAKVALFAFGLTESEVMKSTFISPAQAETILKKKKLILPEGVVVSVSSGSTLASADDPRPEVLQIGKQISAALSKLGVQ